MGLMGAFVTCESTSARAAGDMSGSGALARLAGAAMVNVKVTVPFPGTVNDGTEKLAVASATTLNCNSAQASC